MKLNTALVLNGLVGVIGAAVATFLCAPADMLPAFSGVSAATVLGMLILGVKALLANTASSPSGQIRLAMLSFVASLGLRAVVVIAGALIVNSQSMPMMPFVIAFFGCYMFQNVIELRLALGARSSVPAVQREVAQ